MLSVTAPHDVLHPRTVSDMVNVSDTKNLTQKLSELDAEFKKYLPLTGGTLTGLLNANGGINTTTGNLNINASGTVNIAKDTNITGNVRASGRVISNEAIYVYNGDNGAFVARLGGNGVDLGDTTKSTAICSSETPKYWDGRTRHNIHNDKDNPIDINPTGDTLVRRNADGDVLGKKLLIDNGEIWNGVVKTAGIGIAHYTGSNISYLRRLANNDMDLGHSNYRWRNIYATNGTIQTSDERYKADIQDIDDEQFFDMVKGVSVNTYVMLNERKDKMTKSSLEQPENKQATASSERVQVGIIAQEMAQFDCGKYILVHDEETDIYSVNNYNFTSALMGALKVEISKREELEDLVLELKKEVDTLKAKVA